MVGRDNEADIVSFFPPFILNNEKIETTQKLVVFGHALAILIINTQLQLPLLSDCVFYLNADH